MNSLQKYNGLHLKLSGTSCDGLMSGTIMGYSSHPNTILNYSKQLFMMNQKETLKAIKNAHIVSQVNISKINNCCT